MALPLWASCTYLSPAHLLTRSPLSLLPSHLLVSLSHLALLTFAALAFFTLALLLFLLLALLVLTMFACLLPPSHLLLVLHSKDVFRVTERLGEFVVIALPEIWERRHDSGR